MDDEIEMAAKDAVLHGTGFMKDGKRIDPSEVYPSMTTLTQADLDDMRRRVQGPSDAYDTMTSPGCVHALLDHIAQLTAENAKLMTFGRDMQIQCDALSVELEAQPSAQAVLEREMHLANEYADGMTNGIQWLRNVRDGLSTPTEALAEMESNLSRIYVLRDSSQECLVRPSAQFVAEMREQVQKLDYTQFVCHPTCTSNRIKGMQVIQNPCDCGWKPVREAVAKMNTILAEAAKGEGK